MSKTHSELFGKLLEIHRSIEADAAAADGRQPDADPRFALETELRSVRPSGGPGQNVYTFHTKDREIYGWPIILQVPSPDTDKESPAAVELANWRVLPGTVDSLTRQIWDSIKSMDAPSLVQPEGEPSTDSHFTAEDAVIVDLDKDGPELKTASVQPGRPGSATDRETTQPGRPGSTSRYQGRLVFTAT